MGLAPLTVRAYGTDLRQWQRWMLGNAPESDFSPMSVTTDDLRLWVAHLVNQNDSPRTLRRKISAINTFYRFLVKYKGLSRNPAADIITAKTDKPLPVFIRSEELNSLLDTPYDTDDFIATRNHLILTLLYTTGMRSQELLDLLDRNVDCNAGELKVHGKRNKDRIIPFGEELSRMITHYRLLRDREIPVTSGHLIVRADGRQMYRKGLYNIVHNSLLGAGVHGSRLSPHAMRHSFATDMLNDGAELNAVSNLMGHSSLASTQVYTHLSYRDLKQIYATAHPRALKKGENYGSKN